MTVKIFGGGGMTPAAIAAFLATATLQPAAALTASAPFTIKQTWNNAAVDFTGILGDFTATAVGSATKLLDLKVGGTSKFSVDKDGIVTSANGVLLSAMTDMWNNAATVFAAFSMDVTPTAYNTNSSLLRLRRSGSDIFSVRLTSGSNNVNLYMSAPSGAFYLDTPEGLIVRRQDGSSTTGGLSFKGNGETAGGGNCGIAGGDTIGVRFKTANTDRWRFDLSGYLAALGDWARIYPEAKTSDTAAVQMRVKAGNAYNSAATNTAGGNLYAGPGIGKRLLTVVDYTGLTGDSVTVKVDGVSTTLTAGTHWTAGTSNNATATSLAAAITANVAGVTGSASGATVRLIANEGTLDARVTSTDGANLSVTAGNDGLTYIRGLPTADPGIIGCLWNNAGTIAVSAG